MNLQGEIVEMWMARMADSEPEQSTPLRGPEPDPFRNPVSYAIRNSLGELWKQLLGDMDADAIDSALDTVVRIRAVQDMSRNQAVGFLGQLRPILRESPAAADLAVLGKRIDQLTLAASEKYTQCREQIAAARRHETERLTRAHRFARKAGA